MARPKLSAMAKECIVGWIIEGCNSVEIVNRLADMGIHENLTAQAISYYRNLPQVRAAIALHEREALQSGLARRGSRLNRLNDLALRLESELIPIPQRDRGNRSYLDPRDLKIVDRYLKVLQMIQAIVGQAERRDVGTHADAELVELQRRPMTIVNPWYTAMDAIGESEELGVDDLRKPELAPPPQ